MEQKAVFLHGAIITSEGAPISIGKYCIMMEHAVALFILPHKSDNQQQKVLYFLFSTVNP
jgi:hypothetical protein